MKWIIVPKETIKGCKGVPSLNEIIVSIYFREMAITYSIIIANYITLMGLSESINVMHC